ncbi:thioester domain-containing protein [Arthrobacter sp. zg-Y238]|uniref:thioester domain-containing protein n=1 Tax=Arthrobacter sp. zg-Y238 TaxID=2964614 RepID=UPI00210373A2|nr:thioester domain-containing protein [Arthrobacter sp. zg-Y238]MCQ1954887.1 thioester domain-containing protein [Arthrobacter sp. zg-Y238]
MSQYSFSSGPRRRRAHERRLRRSLLGTAAAAALLLAPFAAPANASWAEPDPNDPMPVAGTNAEVVTTMLGPAQRVQAFVADNPTPPDPLAPYPEENPVGVPVTGRFAGIIITEDAGGGIGQMYCIDTAVETMVGIGYVQGAWEESNVANIGYVNYVLNNYYPANPAAPAGLTANQQAAAVQGAIWYFTDGYLVNTTETVIRGAVEAIVADAQANGPLVEPPPPNVTVSPPVAAGPAGGVAGPFTVASEGAAEVTVSVPTGYTMFADAAATVPIESGSTVLSGAQIWVAGPPGSTAPGILSARASVTVQTGNVYLYDQGDPLLDNAQPLILAASTVLEATAEATAEFFVPGDLVVNKTFAGEAIGSQGAIALTVDCGPAGLFSFEIPAGTTVPVSETIVDLPVGAVCSLTEPVTGSTTEVTVTSTVSDPVTITEGENVLAVTNTVEFNPGNLVVAKTISGSGAGLQEEVVLHIQCGDGLVDEIFVIPEGTSADTFTQRYDGIPAGVMCRVTEPASGANEDVTVESSGAAEVTILPGQEVTAGVVNEYAPVPVTERLPRTGAEDATPMVMAAGGAVLAGSLLVLGSFRRRSS